VGAARETVIARWLVPGVLGVCGCAPAGEKFFPVSGAVSVNGKPLAAGTVSFRPDAERGNRSQHHPTGVIADGRFELHTLRQRGAPLGWYRVLVLADENQTAGPVHPLMPRWATHPKYTSQKTTDLLIEVVETPAPGAYDLRLSP
jgi:hypothetical protein